MNTKKIISINALALIALMFLGSATVHASEVTGDLSASGAPSSQSGGGINGSVGAGSTVSGNLGGSSSTISGTVGGSGGGGGGSGGSGTTNTTGGVIGGGGGGILGGGLVLGENTVPGFPNTGMHSDNQTVPVESLLTLSVELLLMISVGLGLISLTRSTHI